jgi:alpha-ribazole phosphatase
VADNTCYGRSDLALAEDAAAVASRLRPLLPDAPLFSSPLTRCRLLAEALHPAPRFDDRLREIDFGAWEMRTWDEIGHAAIDAWAADPDDYAGHGGESASALRARAVAAGREILAEHQEAILVCHAGVMKALVAEFTGDAGADWISMSFAYGSVSLIEEGCLAWHNRPRRNDTDPAVPSAIGGMAQ